MLKVQPGYGLPCNTCAATQGTWGMNVLIMPPRLEHSVWYQIITYLHVGHVILLILLLALLLATTLAMSWRNCMTLGQNLLFTRLHRIAFGFLSALFSLAESFKVSGCLRISWKAQLRVFLPPRALMNVSHTTCGVP